jgi:hypothetical protein
VILPLDIDFKIMNDKIAKTVPILPFTGYVGDLHFITMDNTIKTIIIKDNNILSKVKLLYPDDKDIQIKTIENFMCDRAVLDSFCNEYGFLNDQITDYDGLVDNLGLLNSVWNSLSLNKHFIPNPIFICSLHTALGYLI